MFKIVDLALYTVPDNFIQTFCIMIAILVYGRIMISGRERPTSVYKVS